MKKCTARDDTSSSSAMALRDGRTPHSYPQLRRLQNFVHEIANPFQICLSKMCFNSHGSQYPIILDATINGLDTSVTKAFQLALSFTLQEALPVARTLICSFERTQVSPSPSPSLGIADLQGTRRHVSRVRYLP